jgi:hypothetical protein
MMTGMDRSYAGLENDDFKLHGWVGPLALTGFGGLMIASLNYYGLMNFEGQKYDGHPSLTDPYRPAMVLQRRILAGRCFEDPGTCQQLKNR